jgi:Flp pilus assembly protein TadG
MKSAKYARRQRGQGFIEAVLGGMILIPIAFCMLDVGALVVANQVNDAAAKQAARSAANEQTQALANHAASLAMEAFEPTMLASFEMTSLTYSSESVVVQTTADVKVPIPFPFLSEQTFVAQATEPVIAAAP